MQTDVTRQSFSSIIVQFILLAALLWTCSWLGKPGNLLPVFAHPGVASLGSGVCLPGEYVNGFCRAWPLATVCLSLLVIFINAFLITKTVSRNLLYPTRTYLPCIFYLVYACGICFPARDLAAVAAAYLLVQASVAFISSFVRTVSFGTTFKGAFLVGLTPLLEPQNALYILMVPVAMLIFRRCGRETLVAVLGSLFPVLLAGYIMWAFTGNFTGVFVEIWREFSSGIPGVFAPDGLEAGRTTMTGYVTSPAGIVKMSGVAVAVAILGLSVYSFFRASSDMRTRAYKINVFALWFLLFAVVSMILPSRACGNFLVLAIPASIVAPAFFVRHRSIAAVILYAVFLTAIAAGSIAQVFL